MDDDHYLLQTETLCSGQPAKQRERESLFVFNCGRDGGGFAGRKISGVIGTHLLGAMESPPSRAGRLAPLEAEFRARSSPVQGDFSEFRTSRASAREFISARLGPAALLFAGGKDFGCRPAENPRAFFCTARMPRGFGVL